jgi:2-polyprenyl-3-methyl-5-hydroxy-6-metoxy-1,4-benzoquinol methylase
VVAVDRSEEALRQGRELALHRGLRVDWVRADLENFTVPSPAFDVIVCFYYRDPALYAPLRTALRPAGLIVYETFTREQLCFSSGPRNPAHLLEPAELLNAFGDWDVIFYQEKYLERAVASLVARKPVR